MIGFLIFIHAVVSLFLIAVVLMQASQGGGLSGTFGGNAASSVLGGQNAGKINSLMVWGPIGARSPPVSVSPATAMAPSTASNMPVAKD